MSEGEQLLTEVLEAELMLGIVHSSMLVESAFLKASLALRISAFLVSSKGVMKAGRRNGDWIIWYKPRGLSEA